MFSTRELTENNDTLFTYDSETTLYSPVSGVAHCSSRFLVESALQRVICLERSLSSDDCATVLNVRYTIHGHTVLSR
ncbi:unnamed protein product [Lasius platythorax]|uniref:Uncharacterized protein n=1 Tax=Lasius platythorax TaxID=488582 RepID=A0AAV2NWT2_9HYME